MRITLLVLTCVSLISANAFAQLNTGTGGRGGSLGGSSMGGTSFGGSSMGGSSMGQSFGGSSMGGRSSGSGTFGSRQLGGGASRGQRTLGGRGGGLGAQESSQVGRLSGSERFMRGNRQGQFVGGDVNSMQGFIGSLHAGQGRGGMGLNQFFGGNQRNNRNVNNQQERGGQLSREERYRPKYKIAFDAPAAPPSRVSETLTARLQKSRSLQFVSPVQVAMAGRTAVLTGEVASDHDRALAEQLVLLEAGVSSVQNDLTVTGQNDLTVTGQGDLTGRQPAAASVAAPPTSQ